MEGRPGRPRAEDAALGLTTGEVAKQLNCSRGNVDRLRKARRLPSRRDGSGKFRFQPADVAAVGKTLGRQTRDRGAIAQKVYGHFLKPGFRGTPEQVGLIVHDTGEDPRLVRELWAEFRMGGGMATEQQEQEREIERIAREYDEQIKAMDEDLIRRRRAVFIPSTDVHDDAPPSSR
jgi:excisionase family DNA binding protein